jgi:hypothetical protein
MASQKVIPSSYSVYAPLRFETTRKYARRLAETFEGLVGVEREWPLRDKLMPLVSSANIPYIGDTSDNVMPVIREVENVVAYVEFASAGRIIYDFHMVLVNALLETDVDKINFNDVPWPMDHCYLHFGDIDWPGGHHTDLEGIYVSKRPWSGLPESWHFTPVYRKQFSVPLYINVTQETRNSDLEIIPDEITVGIDEYCLSLPERINQLYEQMAAFHGMPDSELSDVCKEWESKDVGDPAENSLIAKLAINCMLYIAAVPDDEFAEWDDRAPGDLVHQSMHSEKKGSRKTADNTLANQHYLKIRKIGRKFAHASTATGEHIGGKKVSHLRRGHFRNQAFGPEWKSHRVIFIAPQIIHPDDGDIPGRIYEI